MRILFLGDVFGRSGRVAIQTHLPNLRKYWNIDFVVANCENATQGKGITQAHARDLLTKGIDCMTLGDHAFDQRELISCIHRMPIIRPVNFARKAPGNGYRICNVAGGKSVLVISALGQVFMNYSFDNPVTQLEDILNKYPLGRSVNAIIIDMHCEATSEKMAIGHVYDGRVTLIAGTHTHIPTADARILDNGSAYITDVGMCGDYNSVIGMDKKTIMERLVNGMPYGKMEPANREATLCGVLIDSDNVTGRATRIKQVMIGGSLGLETPNVPTNPY